MKPEEELENEAELRELFDLALELDRAGRAAFVRERTAGQPVLAAELERLLAHHDAMGGFLEQPCSATTSVSEAVSAEPGPPTALLLAIGERLGDYEIESYLGGGGGGQVYRARQSSLGGRRVALKVLATRTISRGDRLRFLRGARMAAEIHHPHLAQVYDCGEDQERGLLFYSMRLVEGPTVQELLVGLQEGSAPEGELRRQVVARCREVAAALAALHEHRVIHQDVKPANILIEGGPPDCPWDGHAALVDFGLVKALDSSEMLSTVWVTLPYAAPEVLLNRGADARSDVYALGLCLYDALAGTAPGQRQNHGDELERLSRRCATVDADLEAVVHRALESNPARRYADGAAFAQDLGAWLERRPVRARRLTRLERSRRWLRRHSEDVLSWGLRGVASLVLGGVLVLAIERGFEFRGAARAAEAAQRSGDYVSLQRASSAIPPPVRALFLQPDTRAILEHLSTRGGALARVVQEGSTRGPAEGLLLAAQLVERDGLAAHPDLGRFLLGPFAAGAAQPGLTHALALQLEAHLFFDRPVETAAELALAAPFQAMFEACLEDPEVSAESRLYALTGLGGCGDVGTVEVLLRYLEGESSPSAEGCRVAAQALELIARRSHACGFARELFADDWDALLARLYGALPQDNAAAAPFYGLPAAVQDLCAYIALGRRRLGLVPLRAHPCPGCGEVPIFFRAANGDQSVLSLLCDEAFLGDNHATGAESLSGHQHAVGVLLAYLGESEGSRETLACVRNSLLASGGPAALAALEAGLTFGHEEWNTWPAAYRPDADTHLGAFLDQEPSGWQVFRSAAAPSGFDASSDSIAVWRFGREEPQLLGGALEVSLFQTPILPDESAAIGFARLGSPGTSEVRFRFRFDWSEQRRAFYFRLRHQKGKRDWLPFSGEASVTLRMEGRERARFEADATEFNFSVPLFFHSGNPAGEYELSLRLDTTSTTTFRIYEAEVLLINEGTSRR